jgi:hypothetical protein
MVFPQLPDITFHDEKSFADLAEKFLQDEPARRQLAAEMRDIVVERFSYTAHWNTFLDAIRAGLQGRDATRSTGFSVMKSDQAGACTPKGVFAEVV